MRINDSNNGILLNNEMIWMNFVKTYEIFYIFEVNIIIIILIIIEVLLK